MTDAQDVLDSGPRRLYTPGIVPYTGAAMRRDSCLSFVLAIVTLAGCRGGGNPAPDDRERLPTGRYLDPVAPSTKLASSFPLGAATSRDGNRVAILLSGYGKQGVQLVDRAGGSSRFLEQRAAFVGVAISQDGGRVYASGGNQDVVYVYDWAASGATLRDSLVLAHKEPRAAGTRYPAGVALSPDGRWLYVAENLADSIAVFDVSSGALVGRWPAGRYAYGVVVGPDGTVYVSAWGARTVAVFDPRPDGSLAPRRQLDAGRHPSAMVLSRDGSRLFVASSSTDRVTVLDTRRGEVVATLIDTPPGGPGEGSTPDALALSPDGTRLYVAEADNNAVATFLLSQRTSAVEGGPARDTLVGRTPVDWYPTALATLGDSLLVLTAKGYAPPANPEQGHPGHRGHGANQYTLSQLQGTMLTIAQPRPGAAIDAQSARVVAANRWMTPLASTRVYPPIEHVVYIIKENRTYDQVLGDLPQADGDTSLVFFPRAVSPNHHALAERFGIYDRFFVNAEVSADGHNWSTAAYATDYVEQTVQSNYSGRGRSYDFEGTNRQDEDSARVAGETPYDDVAEPGNGYLWNLAERAGISFRNYGEFVIGTGKGDRDDLPAGYRGVKPFLAKNTNPNAPGFDLHIQDQHRADVWIAELNEFTRRGSMPALEILRLPNDHTEGAAVGRPTPRAHMADNDLALGRVIEALSNSPFWKSTVVFVLEDDAQDGPDHVDSHRSPLLVISPWARAGVHHRWANTTDVIATIAGILELGSLSQFDHFGEPLRDVWRDTPDLRPWSALTPAVSLDERTPKRAPGSDASKGLDLSFEDRVDDDTFNRILWVAVKGPDVP
ncbi:MAG: bifunctional YncE family protein/alkaline phosphatase family protein, partial [Gemmatimonadaceae bacterium]|nr:bifunctional YncE family protein/alkaline phosphatase family protein [Gemmatimonadaceae bacterium]